ncbi:MAG: type II toxin-antitoxin system PemK/MazF family toxin [Candidatus Kapabacteria bacterium]|jgi:mRNA interferase MazF|nr:type II toxin-antitoxin system PemK/MazF family toxin [Candidatus Kapabacteria bacterium]
MDKGDIVLVTFPFTDLSGSKLRPAVILASVQSDITVCFITTQVALPEPTDVAVSPNQHNGLRKPSVIRTSKIATLDKILAKGLLGTLDQSDIVRLDTNLKILFRLS